LTDTDLRRATSEDVEQALAFALTHDGRKSYRLSSEAMARIVAAHLLRHLEISGFVLMKRPPASNPTTALQSRGGGSDGNFTAALGVPTLDGLGVSGAGAHAEHEHILWRDLAPRAALLAGLIETLE
jgi:hypothetical protein